MTAGPTHGPAVRAVAGYTSQARIGRGEAARVLARVQGMVAADAVHALQFAAGTVCPVVGRVVHQALATAERELGLGADQLWIGAFEVGPGEAVTRVRRLAHGRADWITTRTTAIRVELHTDVFRTESEER